MGGVPDTWTFVFDAIASLGGIVGLFVAARAYAVARGQGRNTFELEVLKELSSELERADNEGEFKTEGYTYSPGPHVYRRVMLFEQDELPTWNFLIEHNQSDKVEEFLLKNEILGDALRTYRQEEGYSGVDLGAVLASALNDELIQAIKVRTR